MTNLTVHAIPYDRMWECWCECIIRRQKALCQPFCPTVSYGCPPPHLHTHTPIPSYGTWRPLTIEHISSHCMKLILVGSLVSAVGHHPTMILPQWRSYSTHKPPTFTDLLSTKLDWKNVPNTHCEKQITVASLYIFWRNMWSLCLCLKKIVDSTEGLRTETT